MRALSKTVYIATVEVDPEWEDELNRWYAEEHVPGLLKVPGYRSARRYVALEGEPKYLGLYEIDSIDAYKGPEHAKAVNTPWTERLRPHFKSRFAFYEQVNPKEGLAAGAAWNGGAAQEGGLLINQMDVPPECEQDFNDWYDQEHLPALAAVEGTIACRRFRAIEGGPKYMAIYHLIDPAVQSSEGWARAVDTPWTHRMRDIFQNRFRMVYRPIA